MDNNEPSLPDFKGLNFSDEKLLKLYLLDKNNFFRFAIFYSSGALGIPDLLDFAWNCQFNFCFVTFWNYNQIIQI